MTKRRRFSWKRMLGLTQLRRDIAKKTGVPTTRAGRQQKLGKALGGCVVLLFLPIFSLAILGFLFYFYS